MPQPIFRDLTSARVYLAAGLPLTWVSGQKDSFKTYLLQKDSVDFSFRGVDYHVEFAGAEIYPQGFSAVTDKLRDFRGVNMLCDIGNGTISSAQAPQVSLCRKRQSSSAPLCLLSPRDSLRWIRVGTPRAFCAAQRI